jgi:hypothetical protein
MPAGRDKAADDRFAPPLSPGKRLACARHGVMPLACGACKRGAEAAGSHRPPVSDGFAKRAERNHAYAARC